MMNLKKTMNKKKVLIKSLRNNLFKVKYFCFDDSKQRSLNNPWKTDAVGKYK